MALPVVKQCCCGCTLQTGTLIIAWIQIVGSILYVISNIGSLLFGVDGSWRSNSETMEPNSDPSRSVGFLTAYIAIGLIQLSLGIVLLIGTRKKLPNYLNVIVIIGIVGMCLYLPIILVQSTLLIIYGLIAAGITLLILQGGILVVNFYVLVVISSFRKEILSKIRGVV